MRIVIGYDGSDSSGVIFEDLTRAGIPRGAEAKVIAAANIRAVPAPVQAVSARLIASPRAAALARTETFGERALGEARKFSATAGERLAERFPDWQISSEIGTGAPASELIETADRWNADLIVVGTQQRSLPGRLFFGSVSEKIASRSDCGLRIARRPRQKAENSPIRLIIGVDGSPAAENAVRAVGRRVWPQGTQARLVAVHNHASPARIAVRLPQSAAMIADHNRSRAQQIDAMIEWALYQLKSVGLNVSISIRKGDPKRILLKEALQWNADSIFLGKRDFGGFFEKLRSGSVSAAVAANAHCSVELVRLPDTL